MGNAAESRSHFSLNPLFWLGCASALGVALARYGEVSAVAGGAAAAFLCLLSLIAKDHWAGTWFCVAAFAAAGALSYAVEVDSISDDRLKVLYETGALVSGDPVEVAGTVTGATEPTTGGIVFKLEAESVTYKGVEQAASGTLRVYKNVSDVVTEVPRAGTRVAIACSVERDERFLNPGVVSRRVLLDQQGIDAVCSLKSSLLMEVLEVSSWSSPLGGVYRLRESMIEYFRSSFTPQTAGILAAATLGNKQFLDRNTAAAFREGGVFHILVISGLHITFIGGSMLWIVRRVTKKRVVQVLAAVGCLWIYVIAVGAQPPSVRAGLMMTLLMLGFVLFRRAQLLNTIGACVLLLLVWQPSELFNPSFQLTVLTVTGIIGIGLPLIEKLRSIGAWTPSAVRPFPPVVPGVLKRFCETLYWREASWEIEKSRNIWSANLFKKPFFVLTDTWGIRRFASFVFEGTMISVVAQLSMLPVGIYLFHRVSFSGVFLNLWIGGLLATAGISAFVAFAFSNISDWLALPFVVITEWAAQVMTALPNLVSQIVGVRSRIPVYSGWGGGIYLFYYVPFAVAAAALYGWRPFDIRRAGGSRKAVFGGAGMMTAVIAAVTIFHPFSAPAVTGKLKLDFLDVGQGDAIFITFPNGETMLVDGGGRMEFRMKDDDGIGFEPDTPRIGEAVVSEFIWEQGYDAVDHLVATHAHTDHIQGLVDVARNFRVGHAYVPHSADESADVIDLRAAMSSHGADLFGAAAGDEITIAGVRVQVLYPFGGVGSEMKSENDRSIVIRLTFGERTILLTGDIEREAEAELAAGGASLKADVVKVAHHGSRTSSTQGFVDAVRPKIAVIPVGRRSMFGHPHQEVVERWRNGGAYVLTTGERGTVTIETDGRSLEVSTFR